jgi:hypothetical protein
MSKIKEYIIQDLDRLTPVELTKVYKYIRTHLIANIPGLEDPMEMPNHQKYYIVASKGSALFSGMGNHRPMEYLVEINLSREQAERRIKELRKQNPDTAYGIK